MQPRADSKILGIGLSKTGTTSLFAALHELGYRSATFRHMKRLGLSDWFEGDFSRDVLDEYDAITDNPISAFYPQLDRRYPGSKFILTCRDKEGWLASTQSQWSKSRTMSKWSRLKSKLIAVRDSKAWIGSVGPTRRAKKQKLADIRDFRDRVRLVVYGITGWSESRFSHIYDIHERNVRWYFRDRPEDLLVMNVFEGDGWEQLCGFLDRPVPDVPFPNVKPDYQLPERGPGV